MKHSKINRAWTKIEFDILILLREDHKNYNLREISLGLFHRSKSATQNKMEVLRRQKVVF